MANAEAAPAPQTADVMTTADGTPLKVSLARAVRKSKTKAALLVAPLLLFLVITFIVPIFEMLTRSVSNPEVATHLPRTSLALQQWDGNGIPSEEVFDALVQDLKDGRKNRTLGKVATRLNYEYSGARSTVMRSARRATRLDEPPYRDALIKIDKDWGNETLWRVIKRESSAYTAGYYLAAVDMEYTADGKIGKKPEDEQIYLSLFWRTVWMSIRLMPQVASSVSSGRP